MQIELVRNATLRVSYAGRLFVIDPYLAPRHSLPSYAGRSPNPTVELPCAPEQVLAGAEMVLISHLHSDHFDTVAQQMLAPEMSLFCQPDNEAAFRQLGFQDVTPIASSLVWHGITITRTPGRHGSSAAVLADMGMVSGFVFQAEGEPTVCWCGDTVLYDEVEQVIVRYRPDVIITHSCGAVWGENELIVMDAAQTIAVCRASPASVVVAVHMEAVDHATVTRLMLADATTDANLPDGQLLIPDDSEVMSF